MGSAGGPCELVDLRRDPDDSQEEELWVRVLREILKRMLSDRLEPIEAFLQTEANQEALACWTGAACEGGEFGGRVLQPQDPVP